LPILIATWQCLGETSMIGGAGSIPTSDNMFHVTSTYIE